MSTIYDQASQRVYCAAQLLDHFGTAAQRTDNPYYWKNQRFLGIVSVQSKSLLVGSDYIMFTRACRESGVEFSSSETLEGRLRTYNDVIQLRGEGIAVPETLKPAEAELRKIFHKLLEFNAGICRENMPDHYVTK